VTADGRLHRGIGQISWDSASGQSRSGFASGRCTIGVRLLTHCPYLRFQFAHGTYLDANGFTTGHGYPVIKLACRTCNLSTGRPLLRSGDQDASAADTRVWLQLDMDTGEVRLRVDADDYGVIYTLTPGFARPLHPAFFGLSPGGAFELLTA
jgi:hypothetical protein